MSLKSVQHSASSATATMTDNRVVNLNVSRADRDYFKTPSMEKLLESLIDSISDATNVTVVCGVSGSGKTTLIDWLNHQARPDWNICRIHARHTIGEKHILEQLNSFYHPEGNLVLEQLAARLAQTDTRRPVIIVDDADKLTTFALDILIRFKQAVENQRGQLGLVLFAQPVIRQLLAGPSLQRYDAIVRTVDLPLLTSEQTSGYIDRWIEVQGYTDSVQLTPAQKQALHKRSGGLPGKLNLLLEQQVDKQGRQEGQGGTGNGTLPVVSGLVATSVAIAIVIAVIFWSMSDEHDESAPTFTEGEVAQSIPPTDRPGESATKGSGEVDSEDPGVGVDGRAAAQEAAPHKQAVVIAKAPQKVNDKTVSPSSNSPAEAQATPITETSGKPTADIQDKPRLTQPAETSPVVAKVEQARIEPVPASTATVPQAKVAEAVTDVVAQQPAEAMENPAEQVDEVAVERPQGTGDTPKQDGQVWLQSQSGENYTVQLAASLDSHAIERFIKSQPDLPELHYVHIKQRNRDWYLSLYGSYSSLSQARTAVDRLPESMRKNSPWIRRLAKLQGLVPDNEVTNNSATTKTRAAETAAASADVGAVAAESTPDAAAVVDDTVTGTTESAPVATPSSTPADVPPQSVSDADADLVLPPVLK